MAKKSESKKPRTNLRVIELLGDRSPTELAEAMGLKFYTQVYQYTKEGANPTLAVMEQIADGLSKILKRKIKVSDLVKD